MAYQVSIGPFCCSASDDDHAIVMLRGEEHLSRAQVRSVAAVHLNGLEMCLDAN